MKQTISTSAVAAFLLIVASMSFGQNQQETVDPSATLRAYKEFLLLESVDERHIVILRAALVASMTGASESFERSAATIAGILYAARSGDAVNKADLAASGDDVASKATVRRLSRLSELVGAMRVPVGWNDVPVVVVNWRNAALAASESPKISQTPTLPSSNSAAPQSRAPVVAQQARVSRNAIGIEFVQLDPGEFKMGCSPGDSACKDDERPAHLVKLTKVFQIAKYEVTSEQWRAVMKSGPSGILVSSGSSGTKVIDSGSPQMPLMGVSWDDAQTFIARLNANDDGYKYRLPTEAEWEYAARAGTTGPYYAESTDVGWFSENSSSQPHATGQKKPNAWGLYDMLGNVPEFVQDWYDATYYSTSPATDPPGPSSGQTIITRGGNFFFSTRDARVSARRGSDKRDSPSPINGFRVVREVAPGR